MRHSQTGAWHERLITFYINDSDTSLTKQQFVVTHTIRQTEIPALPDSSVTNTQSVKTSCPQTHLLLLIFS
jgi:hypothetical protein